MRLTSKLVKEFTDAWALSRIAMVVFIMVEVLVFALLASIIVPAVTS